MASPFSKFEAFAGVVRHNGIDMKPTLLRVLTDLYIQKPAHTDEEETHFTELALRLIEEVDAEARADTARRLDAYGAAPAAVMQRLMQEELTQHGLVLDDTPSMIEPESVTIDVPEGPALVPEQHEDIFESPEASVAEPGVADTVSDSDRAAAARFSDLFFAARSEQRHAILRQLETGAAMPPVLAHAEALEAIGRLEAAALKGRPFEFVREIENSLGLPRLYSEKIVTDISGEPMLVTAKALGMPIEIVQRILLLVNPAIGTSVRRVFELSELYESLSPQSALRLMALWRHAGTPRALHHSTQPPATEERNSASRRQPVAAGKRDQRAS